MKSKPKKPSKEESKAAAFKLPSLLEIEKLLDQELDRWKTTGYLAPYPMPVLDFLIGRIGCEIELGNELEEFGKDDRYYNPSWHVDGITNGELFYSLYTTIQRMTQEEDFDILDLELCDQQAFASMLDSATTLFLDTREQEDPDQGWIDLWILYLWCRRTSESPIWISNDGTETNPPELDQLTSGDWEEITESITEHFVGDTDVFEIKMTLLDEQPHWPTHQEFRKSIAWLLEWNSHTRWNSEKRPEL